MTDHSESDHRPACNPAPDARRRYILRVTAGYAIFGALWILLSDSLLGALVDVGAMQWLSSAKGLFFVVVTTLLLFFSLRGMPGESGSQVAAPRLEAILSLSPARRLWMYGFAVVATLAMLLVRSGIAVSFNERPLLILFMFPVILSAVAGGLGPGLLATLIAGLGSACIYPPVGSVLIAQGSDFFQWSFLVANGVLISILCGVLHRVQRQTEASRRLQAVTLASIGDGVITTDMRGRISFINGEAERLTGWSCGEATGRQLNTVFRVIDEASRQPLDNPVDKVLASGEVVELTNHTLLLCRDGREVPVVDSGAPIRMDDGALAGVVLVFRDDSKRRQAEMILQQERGFLKTLIRTLPDQVWLKNPDGVYLACNARFERWAGELEAEIIGKTDYDFVDREQADFFRQKDREAIAKGSPSINEETVTFADDGHQEILETIKTPMFDSQGELIGVLGIGRDITEMRQAQGALRDSLAEKVALLKEVHHRVKNNLQIVASLLSLQADRTSGADAVAALLDTRSRIRSMALLHEVLYRSESLARIEFAVYVDELCVQLMRSFGEAAARVRVERQVAAIGLPLEQAVPCGLIISELVTNAVKYGFPDGREGRVLVEAGVENGRFTLSVRDNGVGLPLDFDPTKAATLGLQLVTNLAGQLGGELNWERPAAGGASFRVLFPAPAGMLEPGADKAPQADEQREGA